MPSSKSLLYLYINEELDDKLSFDEEVINSESSVTKVVPEGSGKYAAVNKVGGMSYKSENLINESNFKSRCKRSGKKRRFD